MRKIGMLNYVRLDPEFFIVSDPDPNARYFYRRILNPCYVRFLDKFVDAGL